MIPIAVGERSIAFPRRSVKAGVNRARNPCPNPGKQLIPGQPAGEHDVQFRIDLSPVSNGHGPFFRQLPGRQVERLGQGHGVGKDRAATVQPAESAVQALYGVGRVHDLPGSLGELEHGADAVPVVAPAVHAAGILGLPDGPNLVQTGQGSLFVRGMVDRLQVVGKRLLVLVRHVLQCIAYHMHDAPLVFRQRIRRRDGVLDAAQPVRTDHENVLHAAILAGSYAAVTARSARSARTGWKLRCSYALSFSPMVMLRTSFRPSSLSPSIT